jgi:transcriptional regulator with XRE-family HTH domain
MFIELNKYQMPSPNRQLATFIKRHREALGFSMNQLAKEIGVNRSSLHYWEQGTYEPEPQTLEALARGLKVSYEDLFALSGYSNPKRLPNPEPYLRARYPHVSDRNPKLAEAMRLLDGLDALEARSKKRKRPK